MASLRVGHGFDVHALVPDRELVIGGVRIPYEKGLIGHSDADVLLHAIMDALLGAAGLPDIGHHFPPTDPAFKDADSTMLLGRVQQLVRSAGYPTIVNIDATIMAEKPSMSPHLPVMRSTVAGTLELDVSRVSIKATTTERLGLVGREEGIAAAAVCLIAAYD